MQTTCLRASVAPSAERHRSERQEASTCRFIWNGSRAVCKAQSVRRKLFPKDRTDRVDRTRRLCVRACPLKHSGALTFALSSVVIAKRPEESSCGLTTNLHKCILRKEQTHIAKRANTHAWTERANTHAWTKIAKSSPSPGLEPGIFCSGGRRLIH